MSRPAETYRCASVRGVPVLIAILVTVAACDNTVSPFTPSEGKSFALYGFLDSEADTQFVRVSPVIDAAGFIYADSLGAHAILVNLHSGRHTRMQDSSVALDDGRRAYLYYTLTPPKEGAEYRLDVFAPGGDTTRAFTRVPGPDQVDVRDAEEDSRSHIVQAVHWSGVSSVRDIEVRYYLRHGGSEDVVSLSYSSFRPEEPAITVIHLERDRDVVLNRLGGPDDVTLLGVGITADLLSPEWAFGAGPRRIFFASIGRVHKNWTLPDSTIESIGYQAP